MMKKNLQLDKHADSAREDYIRDEGDEDMFCFNKKRKIIPYIAFVEDKGPCVLTCPEHNGGTNIIFRKKTCPTFPISHTNLLIETSERVKLFNQIKMFHKTGTFNGIDTCSTTLLGNLHSKYILSENDESRSITNFPDINAHLSKLMQEKIIYEYVESAKQEFDNSFSSTIDYLKYTKGATFVNLEASIILQDEMKNRKIQVLLDHKDSQPVSITFFK